jgi:extracellular factor (EF) 3-hydroxypalmitic acid methyl ester biosynthesis protein
MSHNPKLNPTKIPLRSMMKLYLKRASEIEAYLSKKPDEWGKFQPEFNAEMDGVFRNIMNFEKENLASGNEEKVYKLKLIFIKRFRKFLARGVYCDWSVRKPYGYAGDFKIIEDIYENNPQTSGFDRLFDNYFQISAVSVAVRNRKDDFKRIITDFVSKRKDAKVSIMDLASGPCREIREVLFLNGPLYKNTTFDCYDNDERSMEFAKNLLVTQSNVNFIKMNAMRLAFRKDTHSLIDKRYDLIYSTGLFDYFSERIAVLLVKNLKKLLNPGGALAIANMTDKYSNPSVHFMEWGGDWNLVYRDDKEFRNIFIAGGFKDSELETKHEQHGIIQYVVATTKK